MYWSCHQVVVTVIAIAISNMSRSVVGLSSSPSVVANQKAVSGLVFYWFRLGDMRLHDNPGLARATAICTESQSRLVPVFCFDPRIFGANGRGEFGSLKCGPQRAKFILESVQDLRESLEKKGSRLVLASEKPEDFFARLLGDLKESPSSVRTKLIYQDEPCSEETDVARKVKKLFQSSEPVWGSTLYELTDLPYESNLHALPDTFTPFRNQVEKKSTIRPPLSIPVQYPTFPTGEEFPISQDHLTTLPTLETLGYTKDQVEHATFQDPRGVMTFKGGETAALERLKDYIWDKDLLRTYFDTRNGMIGADYSSKFSPWLAHGNLSPRLVAMECKKYEVAREANKSTYCKCRSYPMTMSRNRLC
jgi:deoxyribodipyrimidine photo-lyase